jgi:hypothetical protein
MMSRNPRQYIIELDGVIYRWGGEGLEQIGALRQVQGDTWFVSDFETAMARTMTVEAPVKYAEVMIRKKLQETGEFDEPISVITHWKKRKDRNTTDIFFTAVPSRTYYRYLQEIKVHDDSVLLFPLFSVLQGVLRRMRHSKPTAVVFRHSRFADLLIGTNKEVLYANRCVAFDSTEEQLSALWEMVKTDITAAETEHRMKVDRILLVNWIDSGTEPEWSDDMEREILSMEQEKISFSGQDHHVSFLKALRMQSGFRALSPPLEKSSYYSWKCLPCFNAMFVLAILLFVGGYFWLAHEADRLGGELTAVQGQIARLQSEAPVKDIPYEETLSFVRDLTRYRKLPSYKRVVSDISQALPEAMSVEVLKVDYAEDGVNIEIFGKAKSSFDSAYKGYQRFTDTLTNRGYILTESKFDTQIRQSEFLARFTREVS